jgi:hypothetical protein
MDVSQIEITVSTKIELDLLTAERYMNFQLNDRAKQALNSAAFGHRELNRLHRRRRGGPRKALELKIHYYGIWQRAAVGVLETAKGHSIGSGLLNKAVLDATNLVSMYPDSSEFAELLRKVTDWQNR